MMCLRLLRNQLTSFDVRPTHKVAANNAHFIDDGARVMPMRVHALLDPIRSAANAPHRLERAVPRVQAVHGCGGWVRAGQRERLDVRPVGDARPMAASGVAVVQAAHVHGVREHGEAEVAVGQRRLGGEVRGEAVGDCHGI